MEENGKSGGVTARNLGLDMLRILSMCGIIGLHVINQGGIIKNLGLKSVNYYITLLILIIAYYSVNVFGMLSGYLMYKSKELKRKKILKLVGTVIFYCLLIVAIFYIFNIVNIRSKGMKVLLKSLFPPIVGRYWYITCYVLLFFLIPFINLFIEKISKTTFKSLIIVLFIFLSIIPNIFFMTDFFKISNGYSPFWLAFCYLIGAYIGKFNNDFIDSKKKYIKTFFLCLTLSFIMNIGIKIISMLILKKIVRDVWFINYISPFNVICSACLLIIFKDIKINNIPSILSKSITYLSIVSFSVYLSHCHLLIFDYILKDLFVFVTTLNPLLLILSILGSVIGIYIICALIDFIRQFIHKIIKIDKLYEFIGNKIDLLIKIE